MSTKIRTSNLHAEVIEALGGGGGSDVTFTGLLKAICSKIFSSNN